MLVAPKDLDCRDKISPFSNPSNLRLLCKSVFSSVPVIQSIDVILSSEREHNVCRTINVGTVMVVETETPPDVRAGVPFRFDE